MDFMRKKICLSVFLFFHVCFITADAALNVSTIPFSDGFSHLFGEGNILHATDDKSLQLHLNQRTGKKKNLYDRSYFFAEELLQNIYIFFSIKRRRYI